MTNRAAIGILGLTATTVTLCAISCQSNEPSTGTSVPMLDRVSVEQDAASLGVGKTVTLPPADTLDGSNVNAGDTWRKGKGAVFVMTSVGCPVSTKYGPRVAAIEARYAPRGVAFFYVNTESSETPQEMRKQIEHFGFKGPYFPDHDGLLAGALQARTTTEVFVVDPASTLVYRGAIDDQFGVGAAVDAPRHEYLCDALDSVLAGRRPEIGATSAPGCLLDLPQSSELKATESTAAADPDLTYYGRISRIIDEHCVDCHRPGGSAPFSLVGPTGIVGRASMIEAVVRDNLMPPSHGAVTKAGDPIPWRNQKALTAKERDDLLAWLRSGHALGTPTEASVVRARPQGWAIGLPELLVMTPRFTLPAAGPMRHGRFLVPTNNDADEWIAAVEFRPVKVDAVHHALIWLVPPGATLPGPGEIPPGAGKAELLGTYSPGHDIIRYDGADRRRLPAGSLLLVDVYARPMGTAADASMRIAMHFARTIPDSPVERPAVRSTLVRPDSLDIAPGNAQVPAGAEWMLPEAARVIALTPYMRARGRSVSVEALLPDGSVRRLLEAPRFDYRWQVRYEFNEPVVLPAGTRLVVHAVYDNSAANPNNPDPSARVHAGLGAQDEALLVAVEWAPVAQPTPGAAQPGR